MNKTRAHQQTLATVATQLWLDNAPLRAEDCAHRSGQQWVAGMYPGSAEFCHGSTHNSKTCVHITRKQGGRAAEALLDSPGDIL